MSWLLLLVLGLGTDWQLRPGEGNVIRLEVFKTGLMSGKKHVLEFPEFSGHADSAKGVLELTIVAAKLVVKDDWVSAKDLKKIEAAALHDMLAVTQYPLLRYQSTSVAKTADGYAVQGNLTIRDRTKPVALAIREEGPELYSGLAEIDMRQFGLKPPTAVLGAIGTNPVMKLSFKLRVAGL